MFGFWDPKRWKAQRQGADFLSENDGKLARRKLERLLSAHLMPHLRQLQTISGKNNPQVVEAAQVMLYQQLGMLREKSLPLPDLFAVTELVAQEVSGEIRNTYDLPRRRLQHQVLYLLRNRADCFTLEKSAAGSLVAGVPGARRTLTSTRWQRLVAAPKNGGGALSQEPTLALLLKRLLTEIGHQVPVASLVSVVAELAPLTERDALETERLGTGAALAEKLEALYLLRQVWEALPFLPVRQRVVLLLGAQSEAGGSLLPLFLEQGIASETELAQLMEIGPRSFPLLLRELPCDDARLAELLKLTPDNIRQLRQSGRLKLAGYLNLWGSERP